MSTPVDEVVKGVQDSQDVGSDTIHNPEEETDIPYESEQTLSGTTESNNIIR